MAERTQEELRDLWIAQREESMREFECFRDVLMVTKRDGINSTDELIASVMELGYTLEETHAAITDIGTRLKDRDNKQE